MWELVLTARFIAPFLITRKCPSQVPPVGEKKSAFHCLLAALCRPKKAPSKSLPAFSSAEPIMVAGPTPSADLSPHCCVFCLPDAPCSLTYTRKDMGEGVVLKIEPRVSTLLLSYSLRSQARILIQLHSCEEKATTDALTWEGMFA